MGSLSLAPIHLDLTEPNPWPGSDFGQGYRSPIAARSWRFASNSLVEGVDSNPRSPVRRAAVLSLPPSQAESVVPIAEVPHSTASCAAPESARCDFSHSLLGFWSP